jgi:pyrroline-5-carboxylate reductase
VKIGLIGGGAMGEAIVASLTEAKVALPEDIRLNELYKPRLDYMCDRYGVVPASYSETVSGADFVLLAVKPQDFEKAAASVADAMNGTTAVSIMAGVTVARIRSLLKTDAVVRAMPNTPAQIGEGMTAWTATSAVSEAQREEVRKIFAAMGKEAYVPEERYLDMVTALSGSGPGYVFLFIEALIDAGVHVGLSRDLATTMALQTVIGSARYAEKTKKHPAELRAQVTSPAGTTAEGLRALEKGGLRAAVLDAVIAAYERSKALGEG